MDFPASHSLVFGALVKVPKTGSVQPPPHPVLPHPVNSTQSTVPTPDNSGGGMKVSETKVTNFPQEVHFDQTLPLGRIGNPLDVSS